MYKFSYCYAQKFLIFTKKFSQKYNFVNVNNLKQRISAYINLLDIIILNHVNMEQNRCLRITKNEILKYKGI